MSSTKSRVNEYFRGDYLQPANKDNTFSDTALYLAIDNSMQILANALFEMKLEPNTLQNTVLQLANRSTDCDAFLEKILEKNPSINLNQYFTSTNNYALHAAILNKKSQKIIECMAKAGADISKLNADKKSPLDLVLESEQYELAMSFITGHSIVLNEEQLTILANALLKAKQQETLLHLIRRYPNNLLPIKNRLFYEAIIKKDQKLIKELIHLKVDANYLPENGSFIFWAIINDLDETANTLLEMNLNSDTLKSTVLTLANRNSSQKDAFLENILEKNPSLDLNTRFFTETNNTALHAAIFHKKSEKIIEYMSKARADITKPNKQNKSPLDLALESEQYVLARCLIDHHKSALNKEQFALIASALTKHKQQASLELLSKRYPGYLFPILNPLFSEAISYKNQATAKQLLKLGADANYLNPGYSDTMLYLAIVNGLDELANILVEMNLKLKIKQNTVLLLANRGAETNDFLEKILERNPQLDLNALRFVKTGNYSLHAAISNKKSAKIIELMCRRGANTACLNKDNKSTLDLAINSEQFELLPVLLQYSHLAGSTMLFSSVPEPVLSWEKFEYLLDQCKWQNEVLFKWMLNYQLNLSSIPEDMKELVRQHAFACLHYLSNHPRDKALPLQKIFLKRILFESFKTETEVKTEIRDYLAGIHTYSQSCFGRGAPGRGSRVGQAFNLGIFGSSDRPFESLSRKERNRVYSDLRL